MVDNCTYILYISVSDQCIDANTPKSSICKQSCWFLKRQWSINVLLLGDVDLLYRRFINPNYPYILLLNARFWMHDLSKAYEVRTGLVPNDMIFRNKPFDVKSWASFVSVAVLLPLKIILKSGFKSPGMAVPLDVEKTTTLLSKNW